MKFEYQGELHTLIGDLEPYALCNAVTMTCPRYEIVPLEVESIVVKIKKIALDYRDRNGNIKN